MENIPINKLIEALENNGFKINKNTRLRLQNFLKFSDLKKDYELLHTFLFPTHEETKEQENKLYEIYTSVFNDYNLN